ncbi:phage tail assembly protein T [Nocardiopsis suaedae]|uniref:Minor tail T domain-containing protein n=1 Tax=Nocardiopsis suaedae TaxID=3018444 RepID=A0ABT4TMT1_9ACTN|nr:hypothetical protein [Nocardiopsis suaedae]MDA2805700.1 hypothetical protein [Nocardiopsis suaedae]
MTYQIPPSEVLERFTDPDLAHLVAYEKLYGQLGPERFDTLFARLGMDTVAPHMKKGTTPKFEDHVVKWGGKRRRKQSPEEMLQAARRAQVAFEASHRAAQRRREQRAAATAPAPSSGRYEVRDDGGLPTVVDTTTEATEWTGLDLDQARSIAERLNNST